MKHPGIMRKINTFIWSETSDNLPVSLEKSFILPFDNKYQII